MEDTYLTPYDILGDDGIRELARTFYAVMDELPEVRELRDLHAEDLEPITRKLATYLLGWMGGPPVYLAMNGTVCLTDPHAPFHIGPRLRDQWLLCMYTALDRMDVSDELKAMLEKPLFQIAETVRNQDTDEAAPRDPNIIAVG